MSERSIKMTSKEMEKDGRITPLQG